MHQNTEGHVVTPEAVPLALDVAGLGSRMIAILIDTLIQAPFFIALTVAFASAHGGVGAQVAYALISFALVWGYFPLFEGLWRGRTPGKRAQSLRVVRSDGQPVTFANVLVRNLIRIVDILPGNYGVGVVSAALTRKSQRLGDIAAGTIVVRERSMPAPAPLELGRGPGMAEALPSVDTTGLGERDYAVIRSFLQRRESLAPEVRSALASQIASAVRTRVGVPVRGVASEEAFLEALAASYRARFAPPPQGQRDVDLGL